MGSTHFKILLLCSLLFLVISHSAIAKTTSFRPKALLLPVFKDPATLQYLTHIGQGTPLVSNKLTVDLGGDGLWLDCLQYKSSSNKAVRCHTATCSLVKFSECALCIYPPQFCTKNTCGSIADNPIGLTANTLAAVEQDIVSIQSIDENGSNPGKFVSVPKFIWLCSGTGNLRGLANGAVGMAGLGRLNFSIPSQLSNTFGFQRKFAVCLGSSNGVVFIGDGPYVLLPPPGIDVSKSLSYTKLFFNERRFTLSAYPSPDYYINVKNIKINGENVPFNKSLLSFNTKRSDGFDGYGGTIISTARPYTEMQTTIYSAVINAFSKAVSGVPRVAPVAPFGLCFDASKIGSTRVGPAVPSIDLDLQLKVTWRIFGSNSMVSVKDGKVFCLGIVDSGPLPYASIVIGGHQLENNLLQFDLANSRLGFSSSLLFRQTTCGNFNFTSNA